MKDFRINLTAFASDIIEALTDEELSALEWMINDEKAKRLQNSGDD